jgi:hypothetical protein
VIDGELELGRTIGDDMIGNCTASCADIEGAFEFSKLLRYEFRHHCTLVTVQAMVPPPVALADRATDGTITVVVVGVFALPTVHRPEPPAAVQRVL